MIFECNSVLELLFKKQIECQDDILRCDQRDAGFVQYLLSVYCFKDRDILNTCRRHDAENGIFDYCIESRLIAKVKTQ